MSAPPHSASVEPSSRPGDRIADATTIAYRWLRDRIRSGELRPGDEVNQVQVARELGMSRAPIREALRMLESDRLVDSSPHQRTRVAPIQVSDLDQVYALRVAVERIGVELTASHLNADDVAELAQIVAGLDAAAASNDVAGWDDLHVCFHRLVLSHAGERISEQCQNLREHAERYRRLFATHDAAAYDHAAIGHREISAAIAARQPYQAGIAAGRHIAHTALRTLALLEPLFEPVALRLALLQLERSAIADPPVRTVRR